MSAESEPVRTELSDDATEPAAEGGLPIRVGVLLRNEALKARHRLAFAAGLVVFLLFVFMAAYGPFYATLSGESGGFVLPDAWPSIALGTGPMAGLFAATVLMLLTASEWNWKTSRQNVIDGLSRQEWFAGKILLWLALGVVFLGGQLALGGGMALLNTGLGAVPFVRSGDLVVIAGAFVLVLGYLGMGFLTAFLTRSPGSAIGLFFLWIFVEELVGGFLARYEGWRGAVAAYRPHALIGALADQRQYRPELQEAHLRRLEAAGQPVAEYLDTPVLFAAVAAWLVAFAAVAWLVYRRRDL